MKLQSALLTTLAGVMLWGQTDKPSPIHYRSQMARRSIGQKTDAPVEQLALTGTEETGLASFYRVTSPNHRMGNGELFDNEAMVAAHRSLPFGTRVQVTLASTGKSVIVTITDRTSSSATRILNLNERAAMELGLITAGTAQVTVRVLAQSAQNHSAPAEQKP